MREIVSANPYSFEHISTRATFSGSRILLLNSLTIEKILTWSVASLNWENQSSSSGGRSCAMVMSSLKSDCSFFPGTTQRINKYHLITITVILIKKNLECIFSPRNTHYQLLLCDHTKGDFLKFIKSIKTSPQPRQMTTFPSWIEINPPRSNTVVFSDLIEATGVLTSVRLLNLLQALSGDMSFSLHPVNKPFQSVWFFLLCIVHHFQRNT